jgi:PadR family transcriptional regulator, regulatory protein PadR
MLSSAEDAILGEAPELLFRGRGRDECHRRNCREAVMTGSLDEPGRLTADLSAPRNLLRSCVLLLVEERPAHGYELDSRLTSLGFCGTNRGRIYRVLRWLEEAGFVHPGWQLGGRGPARRIYEMTPAGRRALELAAPELHRLLRLRDDKLSRYARRRLRAVTEVSQTFHFTVELRICVQAADEESARRKLDRAFTHPNVVDCGVRAISLSVVPLSADQRS